MPCSHLSLEAQCVKRVINLGGPLARIRLSDPGVKERLQDLLNDAYLIAHVPVAMQTDRDAERAAARQWLGAICSVVLAQRPCVFTAPHSHLDHVVLSLSNPNVDKWWR